MLIAILTLYFLGLGILLFSDFLGLSVFRFRNITLYVGVLIGYLAIVATYAIVKSSMNSIGIFVLIWILGYVFIINKKEESTLIIRREYLQRVFIISVLWTVIFLLKASYFWNLDYNCPNLLFIDNEFYMKVAEGYNLTGNENAFGLKNALFPFLDFAQPYRMNDFWLVSLGLDLTKMDTIYIWELFYSTILIFICSLSLFALLQRKFNLFWALVFSVLFLFAFSGHWYRDMTELLYPNHSAGFDPIGILAYLKLAIVFSILFHFFYKYELGKKIEAVYFLILIPLLVQSALAFFLLVFLIVLICLFQEKKPLKISLKKYLPLLGIFAFLVIGFLLFYLFNQQKEQSYVGSSNMNITNTSSIIDFIIQFFKKSTLLFIAYYWLSIFLAVFLLYSTKSMHKMLRLELFLFLLGCYFCSILVYVKFNKIGDAYQFSTNVFGPFVLALMVYLFIQTPIESFFGKFKIAVLILVSIIGAREMIGGDNFFHSTSRIKYFDKTFIGKVKNVLPQLNYPLGIVYYGKELQNNFKEDYPQHNTAFLKLFGRNYDVFNIEADSLKMDYKDKSNQKINLSIKKNAFNIWLQSSDSTLKKNKKWRRKDFYNAFPFSFCVSKVTKDSLPDYIKSDIVEIIKDENSKIYFYRLNRDK